MKRYPFLKQTEIKDCGATCLSMIISYYGGYIQIEQLRQMTNTTKKGTTAYDIVEAAKEIGFNSYGIHYDLNDKNADKLSLPAIAHVVINKSLEHFIVIYEINFQKKYILVADPASKLKKMSFEEFISISTKRFLIFKPIKKLEKQRTISTLNYLKKILVSKKNILICFIDFFLIGLTILLLTLINKFLNEPSKFILLIISIVIVLKLFTIIIKDKLTLKQYIFTHKHLLNDTLVNLIFLPYSYYRNHSTGEILTRINDIDDVSELFQIINMIFSNLLLSICSLIIIYLIHPTLFLISIIILIFYLLHYCYYKQKFSYQLLISQQNREIKNSFYTEVISGYESIQGQNLENSILKRGINQNNRYLSNLEKYISLENNMDETKELLSDISMVISLVAGILLIEKSLITFPDLLIFNTLLNYFTNPRKKCYFVDHNKEVIKILKNNLQGIENYIILENDYQNFLENSNQQFDIIFLDPPYQQHLITKSIELILKNNLLKEEGIIICEYETEEIKTDLKVIKDKKYGSKRVKIYKK